MYQVIEFVELPTSSLAHTYLCVPSDWVKWRDESKEEVIVAYPVEDPSFTRKRVIKYELYSRDWKCYRAKAEIASGSYDDAVNFIQYLNNKRKREAEVSSDERETEAPSSKNKPSQHHFGKSKLILPPEYDPAFPRWSLKYPKSNYKGRKDLVELRLGIQNTGIFVNRLGYDKCFEESDNDNSLARNLMMEIFSESALQVCTLTGKAFAHDGDGSENRPGLYVHGVNTLVDIVMRNGFKDGDETSIRNCLSSKLYSLRRKNK